MMWELGEKKYTEMFSAKAETFLANTSDLEHTTKSQKAMHHEEIELNFVMSTNSRFGVRNLVGSSQYAYFSCRRRIFVHQATSFS
jgi:hypothetical protein